MLYISWESSLLLIIQLNIAIGTCGMSIGLLIGSFASSSIKSFYVTLLVYLINIMLSGIFWPLDNTELALLPVSVVLPLCIPIRVVKGILIRGRQFNASISAGVIIFAIITITFWTLVSFTTFILKKNLLLPNLEVYYQ
ncbi:uncharacterized protein LOC115033517 [Acyrthosiphon pisum]|uniref:Uncharacterized protein n=1 Tax=Acyrthosiphon pisum TaxID=7029 RepID=A0A8R2JMA2_ACYPI|nr:uncharacterized protein LOC115033517 [Acyrthosiphon pisum]